MALPLRPPAGTAEPLGALPFVLSLHGGVQPVQVLRTGRGLLSELPVAQHTVGVLPASDVTTLVEFWPQLRQLAPQRWREALPGLLEDRLLQSPEDCHLALFPHPGKEPSLPNCTVVVVDRSWMRLLTGGTGFGAVRRLHLVSSLDLMAEAETGIQCYLPPPFSALGHEQGTLVVGWRAGAERSGALAVNQENWGPALIQNLSSRLQFVLGQGVNLSSPPREAGVQLEQWVRADPWPLRLDLCQFEFASLWGGLRTRWRPWRSALRWGVTVLVVQLLGMNLYWARLAWEARMLERQMQQLLQRTLPQAPAGLDPERALQRALENQWARKGNIGPGSFPMLLERWNELARNQPSDWLEQLEYQDRTLRMRFKSAANLEPLVRAAAAQGLSLVHLEQGWWQLAEASSR